MVKKYITKKYSQKKNKTNKNTNNNFLKKKSLLKVKKLRKHKNKNYTRKRGGARGTSSSISQHTNPRGEKIYIGIIKRNNEDKFYFFYDLFEGAKIRKIRELIKNKKNPEDFKTQFNLIEHQKKEPTKNFKRKLQQEGLSPKTAKDVYDLIQDMIKKKDNKSDISLTIKEIIYINKYKSQKAMRRNVLIGLGMMNPETGLKELEFEKGKLIEDIEDFNRDFVVGTINKGTQREEKGLVSVDDLPILKPKVYIASRILKENEIPSQSPQPSSSSNQPPRPPSSSNQPPPYSLLDPTRVTNL